MSTRKTMLFGRECDSSFYVEAFAQLKGSKKPHHRALARNLMYDDRVSPKRQEAFDEYVQKAIVDHPSFSPWKILLRALDDYHDQRVRFTNKPDFADTELNEDNIRVAGDLIAEARGTARKKGKELRLVRIMNLNGLFKVYEWAKTHSSSRKVGFSRFQKYLEKPNETIQGWLEGEIGETGGAEELIDDICNVLKERRECNFPYNPFWAAFWHEFEEELESPLSMNPEYWSRLLGVDHNRFSEQWIAVLVYPDDKAHTYARPTQLDAGSYPRHFPTPKDHSNGGHPMPLSTPTPPKELLSELIHTQIDHEKDDFTKGKSRLRMTKDGIDPEYRQLGSQRKTQRRRLQEEYPDDPICEA